MIRKIEFRQPKDNTRDDGLIVGDMAMQMFVMTLMLVGILGTSCAAKYETIFKGKGGAGDAGSQPKVDVVPGKGGPSDPNGPPSAEVEVIRGGKSVNRVPKNEEVTIRPSIDTADSDDRNNDKCDNPGIVKATYKFADKNIVVERRNGECTSLAVKHTFPSIGDIKIDLIVTSNENETAPATMILTVYDPASDNGQDGFVIKAEPTIIDKGQSVHFTANCGEGNNIKITWNFADGTSGEGTDVTHPYTTAGQFTVTATCTKDGRPEQKAQVTIVVIDPSKQSNNPNDPNNPGGSDGTNTGTNGGTDGGNNPTGDNPGNDPNDPTDPTNPGNPKTPGTPGTTPTTPSTPKTPTTTNPPSNPTDDGGEDPSQNPAQSPAQSAS